MIRVIDRNFSKIPMPVNHGFVAFNLANIFKNTGMGIPVFKFGDLNDLKSLFIVSVTIVGSERFVEFFEMGYEQSCYNILLDQNLNIY